MPEDPVRLTLAKSLTLAAPLPMALAFELRQMFTIQNPEWVANERAGRWNGNTPETLAFYRQTATGVVVPRGALGLVIWLIRKLGYRWQLVDRRRTLPAGDLQFALRGSCSTKTRVFWKRRRVAARPPCRWL